MATAEFYNIDCVDCGISFGIQVHIAALWEKNCKKFSCPNGHVLTWRKPTQTAEQKEINELRLKVKDLETKLEEVQKSLSTEQQKNAELTVELEIWKPSTKEIEH
jgi:hypothetical protein